MTETRSWLNGGFPTYYRIVMKNDVPHLRIFGSTEMFNYPHIVIDLAVPVAQSLFYGLDYQKKISVPDAH